MEIESEQEAKLDVKVHRAESGNYRGSKLEISTDRLLH